MKNGTHVRIVGNGGAFEGWYGTIAKKIDGLYTICLSHDAQCQPKPPYDLQGVAEEHLREGEC